MIIRNVLLATLLVSPLTAQAQADNTIDVSRIRTIVIKGDPTDISVTTRQNEPYAANVTDRREGWFGRIRSFWADYPCGAASKMQVDGDILTITITSDMPGCRPTLKANVPQAATISIEQAAAKIALSGTFVNVSLKSDAADFNFNGEAQTISAEGNALKIRIAFTAVHNNETVSLHSSVMDAEVNFGGAKAICYRVDAVASMIDSRYQNTPGAKPEVYVKADKAKISLQ